MNKQGLLIIVSFLILLVPSVAAETIYDSSSMTECGIETCETYTFVGTRFGYEDEQWKPVEDMKSLKGTGIECVVVYDNTHKAECLDWNYTAIKIKFYDDKIVDKGSIPVKVFNFDDNKWDEKSSTNIDLSTQNSLTKWIEVEYGEKVHYGKTSTEIILQDAGTENSDDTQLLQLNPNDKGGTPTSMVVRLYNSVNITVDLIKFIIPPEVQGEIIDANLSLDLSPTHTYHGNIDVLEVNNQTWNEEDITWNKAIAMGGIHNVIDTTDSTSYTSRMQWNVTPWVSNQTLAGNTNVSFAINTSAAYDMGANYIKYSTKESGGAAMPFLWLLYNPSDLEHGINISIRDATNTTIIGTWNVTFYNGTDTYTEEVHDSPFKFISINQTGAGIVNVTIWREGFDNATYSVQLNGTHAENLTGWIYETSRGLINIAAPAHGSFVGSGTTFVNITAPDNMTGNVSMWYSLNGATFAHMCTDCKNYTGQLSFEYYGSQSLLVMANSSNYHDVSVYGTRFYYSNFTNTFAVYNVTIRDELSDLPINFSFVNYAELKIYCPSAEQTINITANAQDINVSCDFSEMRLLLMLHNDTTSHFRTLRPEQSDNPVIFYMFENTTYRKSVVDFSLYIADDTGTYKDGMVRIEKIINVTRRDIIEQNLDANGRALIYMMAYERYFLSIVSNDGTSTRSLGEFRIVEGETSRTIHIGIIAPFDYDEIDSVYKTIMWAFIANQSTPFIRFIYNDTGFSTQYVEFWVYNGSDTSDILFHDLQYANDVIFTYNNPDINQTYIATFEAQHNEYGLISETRTIIFDIRRITLQVPEVWYTIVVVFVLMFTSLLFGAKAAPWGAVVVSLEAIMFFIFGWFTDLSSVVVLVIALLISILSVLGYRRKET